MKFTRTIKKNYEFNRVYKRAKRVSSRHLTLYYLPRSRGQRYLGITVARKVRGSVRRNKVKRWLREIYRLHEAEVKPGYSMIILGRVQPEEGDFHRLEQEWLSLLRRSGLANGE